MNLFKKLLPLLLFLLAAGHIHAQQAVHELPFFRDLDRAVETGDLTREEALLEKFRYMESGLQPFSAIEAESNEPVKCGTPLHAQFMNMRDQLPASVVAEIEQLTERPNTEHLESYTSPGGHFTLYYQNEGTHAVPQESTLEPGVPDYIHTAAAMADSSYRYQVETLGFTNFLRDQPYEIFFENIPFYGTTTSSGSTTYITIHNNFDGFPQNSHPDGNRTGALLATIAHEIKHAIQFAANRWQGDAGSFDWMEMDATMMEEIVHPDVNDYYNYIKTSFDGNTANQNSIFGTPGNATPGAYWHVTWMLYFAEVHGIDFWVDVWEQFVDDRTKPFFDAISQSLNERGESLQHEHLVNIGWHLASGPEHPIPPFGFADRENYPNPSIFNRLDFVPGDRQGFTLRPKAAHYIGATPSNVALGQPRFILESTINGVGLAAIGYFRDGSADLQFALNPSSSTQDLQTTWRWEDLADIRIAVVNTNRSGLADYHLDITSALPDEDLLAQNYPNPFRGSTRIEFALNRDSDVRIEVYDNIGRRVQTLVDRHLPEGFHHVDFDAGGLASGVYFYRIITDRTVLSQKMVFIR